MVFETKRNDTFGYRFGSHGFMFRPQKPGGASGRGFKRHAAGMWSLCTSFFSQETVSGSAVQDGYQVSRRGTCVSDSPILGRWSFLSTGVTGAPERDHSIGWTLGSQRRCAQWRRPWSSDMARRQQFGALPRDWARPWSGGSSAGNLWASGRKNHPIDCNLNLTLWWFTFLHLFGISYINIHAYISWTDAGARVRANLTFSAKLASRSGRLGGTMELQNEFPKKLVIHHIHQWLIPKNM